MSNGDNNTRIKVAKIGLIGILGAAMIAILPHIIGYLKINHGKVAEMAIVPIEKVITAVGGWSQGGGDPEMDTNSRDYVPATTTTELYVKDNIAKLDVEFWCEEYRGNHTTFSGKQSFMVYTPPKDKKIVKIEAKGGLSHSFSGHTVGQNHSFNPFEGTDKTYWKNLSYRVDSSSHDDGPYVGVKGILTCNIFLQETKTD